MKSEYELLSKEDIIEMYEREKHQSETYYRLYQETLREYCKNSLFYNIISFFFPSYWEYVFQSPWTWKKVFCRMKGHPAGLIWFNPTGSEPDCRCSNCFDDLG